MWMRCWQFVFVWGFPLRCNKPPSHRHKLLLCRWKKTESFVLYCHLEAEGETNRSGCFHFFLYFFICLVQITESPFSNGKIIQKFAVVPSENLTVQCTVSNKFGSDSKSIDVLPCKYKEKMFLLFPVSLSFLLIVTLESILLSFISIVLS